MLEAIATKKVLDDELRSKVTALIEEFKARFLAGPEGAQPVVSAHA